MLPFRDWLYYRFAAFDDPDSQVDAAVRPPTRAIDLAQRDAVLL